MRTFTPVRKRGRRGDARPALTRYACAAAITGALLVLGLLAAGPAFASSVSSVSLSGTSQAGRATNVTWTVGFRTSSLGDLTNNDSITVTFGSAFTVPATPTVALGAGFSQCAVANNSGSGGVVTFKLTGGHCSLPSGTTASLTIAGITNGPAGTYAMSVKTSADTTSASASVTISVGAAAKLAFTTQPSSTATAGSAFGTQPVVKVQDADGNTVATDTSPVTLALTTAPGAALTCASNPVSAGAGVAAFSGCKIDKVGSYTLSATDGSLTSATSTSTAVNAAAAGKLAFVQGPSDAFAGSAMTPAVSVQVQDQFGNAVAASGTSVTLAPSTGTINSGAAATTNAAGLATFNGVTINNTALGLTLTASAGSLSPATSATFNVTVKVTTSTAVLTTSASDTGSGVKSVRYYYCAGYSGTCTNGALVGTATTGPDYSVIWVGQPADGAYRVVTVGADNVDNASGASSPTPVTVAN
jgi:hypothetical protein